MHSLSPRISAGPELIGLLVAQCCCSALYAMIPGGSRDLQLNQVGRWPSFLVKRELDEARAARREGRLELTGERLRRLDTRTLDSHAARQIDKP
jgi:hypothetical protein